MQRNDLDTKKSITVFLTNLSPPTVLILKCNILHMMKSKQQTQRNVTKSLKLNSQTPWPQSASELYRQSGHRRAKLVPTFADRGVSRGQRNESPRQLYLCSLNLEPLLFYSSSSSIDLPRLTRLSGPRSRPTTTQKIWYRRESNPGPLYL
jgi:hypothetical protein